jgi:predicted secreted protein
MTNAILAQGMDISWGADHIEEVTNFTLNYTVDQVEVTNHDSVGGAREYIAGLFTPSEVSFTVNYIPASHDTILANAGDSTTVATLSIVTPDASGGFSVQAWVKGFNFPGPATGEAMLLDIVFQTTGVVSVGS